MTVALLSIGTELLRGEILDTNARWLASQLTQTGFDVAAMESAPDDPQAIAEAIGRLMAESPLVVATGGLGPTSDDVTAAAAAQALGVELSLSEDALAAITRQLERHDHPLRPGHRKQAMLPVGAELLPNGEGTAPGFVLRAERSTAYFLPGVPHEMRAVFNAQVAGRIRGAATNNGYHLCLHTFGIGESRLAEQLEGIEAAHPQVRIGYYAKSSEIDVRLSARGPDYAQARERVETASAAVRERLGHAIYGEGDDTIWHLACRAVRTKGWRLAVAESCTGGLIAQQLTSEPASDYFVGGTVAYANTAKSQLLGVSEDTLRGHGAVSAEVAAEMAEGVRRVFECDVGVSVTGIAGPTGATADKPLGLCYWAVSGGGHTEVEHDVFSGSRNRVQHKAAHAALDLLRRSLDSNV